MARVDPMRLSIIICVCNMAREAPRTILSACAPYQKGVDPEDYEVIVVDNGSDVPFELPDEVARSLSPRPRIFRYGGRQPSPVFALNWAATTLARGEHLMFCIDGARIFSDHLVVNTLRAHALAANAFVHTLGCHIGPKKQTISTSEGYCEAVEDELIARSGWPESPAALYGISVLAGSSGGGLFRPLLESNAFSVPREQFRRLRGYDERFTSPGGGLANLEIFGRYVTSPGAVNVCLLSDTTFHQTHGGIATSGKVAWETFHAEYVRILGRDYAAPEYQAWYLGPVRPEARNILCRSVESI